MVEEKYVMPRLGPTSVVVNDIGLIR